MQDWASAKSSSAGGLAHVESKKRNAKVSLAVKAHNPGMHQDLAKKLCHADSNQYTTGPIALW